MKRGFKGLVAVVSLLMFLVTILAPGIASASRCELDPTRCGSRVTVVIDGETLAASPPAFIEDGRVLVPLRALSEALGATVEWDDRTQTVTAYFGEGLHYTRVRVGQREAENDYWPYLLDVPTMIANDRTYVPLRFMVEALGASVTWDSSTRTATVVSISQPAPLYTEALEAAVLQLAPYMNRCAVPTASGERKYALCLDPGNHRMEMSPALFRQAKWYMDATNAVAQAPDFQDGQLYDSTDAQRLVRNVAVPDWNPSPGLQPATRVAPSPSLLAVLLGCLGLLSGDAPLPTKIINETQATQVSQGYQADSYRTCELKAGTIIYGGLPGPSNWFTDAATLEQSGFDASVLWQLLQVPPSKEHMSYRPMVGRYRLKKDVTVACGNTGANRIVKLKDGTRVYAGEGGGFQYFLPDFDASVMALEGELIQLENWKLTEAGWAALVR